MMQDERDFYEQMLRENREWTSRQNRLRFIAILVAVVLGPIVAAIVNW